MDDYSAKKAIINSLLNSQRFFPEELDHHVLEKKKKLLEELSTTSNSAISIFDMYRQEHVFYSSNYGSIFGYDKKEMARKGLHFMEGKIHPDDIDILTNNGISLLKLFFNFSLEEKASYKFINEYRVLKADQTYVRVIEQDQILAFDPFGNMWLSLGIIDIAPNQLTNEGLKSQVVNFKSGAIIKLPKQTAHVQSASELTQRELQVLKMIKGGLLSKEISGRLAISVNTVNTHRQRILEKLKANNSLEAVSLASNLGII